AYKRQGAVGGPADQRVILPPLIGQRPIARGRHADAGCLGQRPYLALRLGKNLQRFALAAAASIVNGGNLSGGEGAVVNGHFINFTGEWQSGRVIIEFSP